VIVAFFNSWVSAATFCVLILMVCVIGWRQISQAMAFVQQRNKQLYSLLFDPTARNADENYWIARKVQEEIRAVEVETSPSRQRALIRDFQVQAARLEGSVAFYVDILRQLGLLGTVVGLGVALFIGQAQGSHIDLLAPLGTAVWTTITGLVCSIVIHWRYGREVEVHSDECERNLEAWQSHLKRERAATNPPVMEAK
jgi:biopolymer transport protein ExbB/TolQ